MLKTKFLEVLEDAYPQGYSPVMTSANELQLFREKLAYVLESIVLESQTLEYSEENLPARVFIKWQNVKDV